MPSADAYNDGGAWEEWQNSHLSPLSLPPEIPRVRRTKARDFFGHPAAAAEDAPLDDDESTPSVVSDESPAQPAARAEPVSWFASAREPRPAPGPAAAQPPLNFLPPTPVSPTASGVSPSRHTRLPDVPPAGFWPRDLREELPAARAAVEPPSAAAPAAPASARSPMPAPAEENNVPLGILFQQRLAEKRAAAARLPLVAPRELPERAIHRQGPREIPPFETDPLAPLDTSDQQHARIAKDPRKRITYLQEIGRGLARGSGHFTASLGGFMRMMGAEQAGQFLTEAGQDYVDDHQGTETGAFEMDNPRWWASRLPEVASQALPQLGLAFLTRGRSVPAQIAAFTLPSVATTAGEVYNEAHADRLRKGDTSAQARDQAIGEAALVGILVGSLEAIPGAEILTKNPAIRSVIGKAFRHEVAQRGIAGFLADGLASTGQDVVRDLLALGFRGDAERFKDVWERYPASFVLGGAPGAIVNGALGMRDRAGQPPAAAPSRARQAPAQPAAQPTGMTAPAKATATAQTIRPDSSPPAAPPVQPAPAAEGAPSPAVGRPPADPAPRPPAGSDTTPVQPAPRPAPADGQGSPAPALARRPARKDGPPKAGAASGTHPANPSPRARPSAVAETAASPSLAKTQQPASSSPSIDSSPVADWGSVKSPQQLGTPIETRDGRQGKVVEVGDRVVKFIGPDGKLDAAHINNVRPQQASPPGQRDHAPASTRPWGDVTKSDIGRVVEDRKGRRGVIYQVGRGGAVAARGADGKAIGIAPGQGRVVMPFVDTGQNTTTESHRKAKRFFARGLNNPPADVLKYSDAYSQAVQGRPQDLSDLVADAIEMVRQYPSGRSFKIHYNQGASWMDEAMIYLRKDARRWEFIEEFSHWRMTYGDVFLREEKKELKKQTKKLGLYREGTTAEEIAIKSHLIENATTFGLEEVDVEYLKKQIASLWIYGSQFY